MTRWGSARECDAKKSTLEGKRHVVVVKDVSPFYPSCTKFINMHGLGGVGPGNPPNKISQSHDALERKMLQGGPHLRPRRPGKNTA